MRIEWVAICRYAESTDAAGTTAVGLHAWLSPPVELPWEVSLALVVSFTDLTDLPGLDGLSCRVADPSGATVYDESWPLAMEAILPDLAGAEPRHAISLGVPFTAHVPGRYEITLTGGEGAATVGYVVQVRE
jgi:hypothetical protein